MPVSSDNYLELKTSCEGVYKEKGSKFIALAFPALTEEEVKTQLAEIRKTYYDARHHCYAYLLGVDQPVSKASDDGEPSGSAGKPILNQILSKGLTNTCIVVVRYFGGVKLGVSGLVNAYKTAAREALANGEIVEQTIFHTLRLQFDYPLVNEVMRVIKEENLKLNQQKFEMQINLELFIERSKAENMADKFRKIFGVSLLYDETNSNTRT